MIRQIIKIDEDKCNGCGLCAEACHESAIKLIDGKAKLIRDDFCDGLGNCLPVCPTGAISFEKREALDFNEEEIKKQIIEKEKNKQAENLPCGCPGTHSKELKHSNEGYPAEKVTCQKSELRQWPVQIKLAPFNAPYFKNANLLISADCAAYAYAGFHSEFMKNRITLIGCPKLDNADYSEKLTEILKNNDIKSVTVVRMEVPCCGGIVSAVKTALKKSEKMIPWRVVVLSTDGEIIEE